jgi:hypothetical protein
MRCFFRIRDILGRRTEDGASGQVVLEHQPSGAYLSVGGGLADDAANALVFPSEAEAINLVSRFACEPGHFNAVAAPALALSNVA